jgi:hypothetical protein
MSPCGETAMSSGRRCCGILQGLQAVGIGHVGTPLGDDLLGVVGADLLHQLLDGLGVHVFRHGMSFGYRG